MNQDNPNNWSKTLVHPTDDDLLFYLDGELAVKEADSVRAHLEACWPCRNRLEKFESTILLYVDTRNQVLQPLAEPPNHWGGFAAKLHEQAEHPIPATFWERWSAALSRFHARISKIETRSLRLAGISSLAVVLIAALFYNFVIVAPVSAADLVNRSIKEQAAELKAVDQPVIRQSLKVARGGESNFVSWETWNDTANSRVRTAAYNEVSKPIKEPPVIIDLRTILRMNHMNEQRPLTAASYKDWSETLAAKTEQVINESTDLTIVTARVSDSQDGQISEARLAIRKTDYHPTALYIKVRNSTGRDAEYDLVEQEYAVLSLKDVDPAIFADTTKVEIASKIGTNPSPETSPNGEQISPDTAADPIDSNSNSSAGTATADLEVEVMDLLNRAKADMGEQITVERQNGVIHIRGIVDNDARKREILNTLQPVAGSPRLRIEIQTLAEALAAEKNKKQQGNITSERITPGETASATEADLIQHFGSVEAARAFGSQMVTRSGRALSHAYALKRLMDQFKPSELRSMSPDARAKFVALVAQHARDFESETSNLRESLQEVFGNVGAGGSSQSVNGLEDLPLAVAALLNLGQQNDRVLRSAMTVSSEGPQFSELRTPQFWQSLRSSELLASRIAAVR